jgi:outer membrane protein OmpA-like peptidoglycan-associated protein
LEWWLWDRTITAKSGKGLRMGKRVLAIAGTFAGIFAGMLGFYGPAHSLTLEFPGPATATATKLVRGSYALPTAPWSPTGLPADIINGSVDRAAWQIDAPGLSSLDLMAPLRAQLVAAGFTPVFDCETDSCGGFDFRFAIEVLPEPDMHVDLGDFRFLSARKGDEVIGLLVSRSALKGFVQMTRAVPDDGKPMFEATNRGLGAGALGMGALGMAALRGDAAPPALAQTPDDPMARLLSGGSVVLDGLDFGTGAADLTEGRYASLAALADWLGANPGRAVALVGHTDATGGLEGNIVISRRRAASVRARLMQVYGVPAAQIEAEGVGYLAPIASNLTEEGRSQNRRVEAVLIATE